MRTVWTEHIPWRETTKLEVMLPLTAHVVHVSAERLPADVISIWIMIPDTEHDKELKTFEIFGTGVEMPNAWYCGTAVEPAHEGNRDRGRMVFHVFDVTPEPLSEWEKELLNAAGNHPEVEKKDE